MMVTGTEVLDLHLYHTDKKLNRLRKSKGGMHTTKIMAVDDEPDTLDLIVKILKSGGYDVVPCESGTECLSKFRTEKPDLILLDILMPDIDGHQVLKNIKEIAPEQRVAFLTVLGVSAAEKEAAIKEGATDYIRKPITPEGLLEKVKEILAK